MLVLGIDPGVNGALCVVRHPRGGRPRIVDCIDVPRDDDGVEPNAVIDFIQRANPDAAYIERVSAMPSLPDPRDPRKVRRGMGATSAFNFGAAVGTLRTCVRGLGVDLRKVEPVSWKKLYGLSSRDPLTKQKLSVNEVKEASRRKALSFFENAEDFVKLVKHHNRAESALIAYYGLKLATA